MASPDVLKYRTQAFPPLFSPGKEERKLGSALLNLGEEKKKKAVTGMLEIPKLKANMKAREQNCWFFT